MKKTLLPMLIAVLSLLGTLSSFADQIFVGGQNRTYYTYIPADLGENRPMLISMHGMNQDAMYQKGMLQIESVADTAKFAVVFPEGIDRSWDISGDRDINFVCAIIDDMVDRYGIDRNRVYLSGFSMGGMFTYHAMNKIEDKIAAFAPISGYPMWGGTYESRRPIPIIHTHGTTDDVVTFDNVHDRLNGWIARNNCASTPLITEPYKANGVKRYLWGPGDEGMEVVLMELANKGHWISNDGIHTGNEIWLFCSRYSLDRHLPDLKVITPAADREYTALGTNDGVQNIYIKASATSKESTIASVKFYGDEELLGEVTSKPYEFYWRDVPKGSRIIKVVATDADGNSVGRSVPLKVKTSKTSVNLSSQFKENGIVPDGWVTYDGKKAISGPATVSDGGRVIAFTGNPVDFKYGMYFRNITGKANKGYAVYGDDRSKQSLMLTTGTYELSFDACNWNMPQNGLLRCEVVNLATGDVVASTSVLPTVNIGNSAANPFTGVSKVTLSFPVFENDFFKFYFYTEDAANADGVVANIKVKKVSTDSVEDIEAVGEPVSVEYYDMLGRRVYGATNSPVIRMQRYSDGTVRTDKTVR